jgi:hypothetical protein
MPGGPSGHERMLSQPTGLGRRLRSDVLVSTHDRGWLIEPKFGGYLHARLYEIRTCPIDDFQHETWTSVALDAREFHARARCLLAGPAEYSFGGNLLRGPRVQDRITGHPLVIATRQTPCCGRLTEIAVSSLFGSVEELYELWPEPRRGCGDSHPKRSVGAQFVEVLPKLRKIISRNNEVLSWGPGPLLALHAETTLTGVYVDFDLERWPTKANGWIDMQAWEATWRTATYNSAQATALDVRQPAAAGEGDRLVAAGDGPVLDGRPPSRLPNLPCPALLTTRPTRQRQRPTADPVRCSPCAAARTILWSNRQ